jgi:phage terminase large subunit-like protein
VFPDDDGGLDALVEFWSPGETLAERAARDQAHYDLWARQGHLHAPPGKTIDYGFVVERLAELAADYDIEMIAFDPWRREDLERALDAEAVTLPLKPHGQGFQGGDRADRLWMPRSVEKLEEAILQGRLRVRANPVLFWCASSAVIESDPKGNRIFSKRRATGRIDGVVALAMAVGAATAHSTVVSSIYNDPSAWDDEPRASDGGLPDQAILDDPKHPLWHEHRRRYEERLAMMDGEDRWI